MNSSRDTKEGAHRSRGGDKCVPSEGTVIIVRYLDCGEGAGEAGRILLTGWEKNNELLLSAKLISAD